MTRCTLVLNEGSGGNDRGLDAREVAELARETFRKHGRELVSRIVPPAEIEAALERAAAENPAIIIVGGGDGTVATAAKILGGTDIALGILPMGTFNLAARDLGVPLEMKDAVEFLATADIHPIDVLYTSGHACLCTTILGFYPEFSHIFEKRDHGGHWWKKVFKLIGGLRQSFTTSRPLHLEWTASGKSDRVKTKFAAFVPGRYAQSTGLIPARTDFRSGKLTAYLGTQKTPAAAMRAIFDYAIGRQEENPGISVLNESSFTLNSLGKPSCKAMIDGEILRLAFPIEFRVKPDHLHVLTTPENISNTP